MTGLSTSRPRRVLMVSPHFPPDTSAGAHRVRLLAPHLLEAGWEPTVLTAAPDSYEGRLDPGLEALVPRSLRVVRRPGLPAAWTRGLGLGDLGLRLLPRLALAGPRLLARERFDALFVTVYPTYPAVLGPWWRYIYQLPFVLDYQDPWVGAWGETVGGGEGGEPDLKSRLTRRLGSLLEPRVLAAADGITAVSRGTWEAIFERHPELSGLPTAELPLGGEERDFRAAAESPRPNGFFPPHGEGADSSGSREVHLVYVGTLLPLGLETLEALLRALARLRDRSPRLYERLHLHFFGTSNQTRPDAPQRVLPVARKVGVADRVTETAPRIDYLDALRVLTQASGVLLLGSTEPHYTASKLYPALLARRPVLAAYHEASSVDSILAQVGRAPTVRRVSYGDGPIPDAAVERLTEALAGIVANPVYRSEDMDLHHLERFSARSIAGRLAGFLDRLVERFQNERTQDREEP